MPLYSKMPSQPFTGNLPGVIAMGPPDLLPSSEWTPHMARRNARYGRQLAGLGAAPDWTEAELSQMAARDDVQGSGIFDPPGTQPNIHPSAGIFAARASLPGYYARTRDYVPSEVIDATTGRPVVYVPGGAVSLDSAAQIAFLERGAYAPPSPLIQAQQDAPTDFESISSVMQARMPIGRSGASFAFAGLGEDAPTEQPAEGMSATAKILLVALGAAALGAGAAYAMRGKGKGKKKR